MSDKDSRAAIRYFYEGIGGFYDQHFGKDIDKAVSEFLIGYLRLGDIQSDGTLDFIELSRISSNSVPKSVIDSFERHVWYSKNSLSDIWVIKVPFEDKNTFGILVIGYVDDGWDNGCCLFEVYNDQGELVGSTTNGFHWEDRQYDHTDYFHQPTPPYDFSKKLDNTHSELDTKGKPDALGKWPLFWSDNDVREV